jgi:hypothetical protein
MAVARVVTGAREGTTLVGCDPEDFGGSARRFGRSRREQCDARVRMPNCLGTLSHPCSSPAVRSL